MQHDRRSPFSPCPAGARLAALTAPPPTGPAPVALVAPKTVIIAGSQMAATLGRLCSSTALRHQVEVGPSSASRTFTRDAGVGCVVLAHLGAAVLDPLLQTLRDVHELMPAIVIASDASGQRQSAWYHGAHWLEAPVPQDDVARLVDAAIAASTSLRRSAAEWAARWRLSSREGELLLRSCIGVRHGALPRAMGVKRSTIVTLERRVIAKAALPDLRAAVSLVRESSPSPA